MATDGTPVAGSPLAEAWELTGSSAGRDRPGRTALERGLEDWMVERRGFEPLTSAVRGREYESEYEAGCECLFDRFPRDGGHRETRAESERQPISDTGAVRHDVRSPYRVHLIIGCHRNRAEYATSVLARSRGKRWRKDGIGEQWTCSLHVRDAQADSPVDVGTILK